MTHLEGIPSDLLDLLAEEQRLFGRMIAVAEAKRDALLVADVDALTTLVREMESATHAIERLEAERLSLMRVFVGDDAETVTLDALLARVPAVMTDQLSTTRDALRGQVLRLRSLNDANAGLVQHALTLSERWGRLLYAAIPATYDASGVRTDPPTISRAWSA